ncbi:MAG: tripartite tricarboxylate transporter substrate-binding protein [Deltaproteobacteria bacterium]|nr:tripartite tricarboxylate transporter substrate-binding protein [Deltaproteobacteria bacterium]
MNRKAPAGVALLTLIVALCAWFYPGSPAHAASSFYEGKTIKVIVGVNPGGGFDTFARMLARHLPLHIPGKPKFIVQNMPGAGSLIAANRVYAEQPGDGLTIVNFAAGIVMQALIGDPAAKFDPKGFLFLGDPSLPALPRVLWVRGDLPIRTLADLKKRKEPLAVGATGVGQSAAVMGEFERALGLPIKVVTGYKGSTGILAALERKELEGMNLSLHFVQDRYGHFIENGTIRPFLAIGTGPGAEAPPGVATLRDLTLNSDQRKLADFLIQSWSILRLYALPPGTPPDRLQVLQEAFLKALASPQFVSEAKRQGIRVSPRSGKDVARIIQLMTDAPPAVVAQYKKFLGLKK